MVEKDPTKPIGINSLEPSSIVEIFTDDPEYFENTGEGVLELETVSFFISYLIKLQKNHTEQFNDYLKALQEYIFQLDYPRNKTAILRISFLILFRGDEQLQNSFVTEVRQNFPYKPISSTKWLKDLLHQFLKDEDSFHFLHVRIDEKLIRSIFLDLFPMKEEVSFLEGVAFVRDIFHELQNTEIEYITSLDVFLKVFQKKIGVFTQQTDKRIVELFNKISGLDLPIQTWKHLPVTSKYQSVFFSEVHPKYILSNILSRCGICGTEYFGEIAYYCKECFICESCYLNYRSEKQLPPLPSEVDYRKLLLECAVKFCQTKSSSRSTYKSDFKRDHWIELKSIPVDFIYRHERPKSIHYEGHTFMYDNFHEQEVDGDTVIHHSLYLIIPAYHSILHLTWKTYEP